jgi:hypothetical protein
MFTCIGKRKGAHGRLEGCTNTSETPSNPSRPDWGYLCPTCLGTQYGRTTLTLDLPDVDMPEFTDYERTVEYYRDHTRDMEPTEAEEIANLQELDIL